MNSYSSRDDFLEALLLPLINKTLEILMANLISVAANLYFMYQPTHLPSSPPEYFEIGNHSALLAEWQRVCGSRWADISQVIGIPPGNDWRLVEWDVNARSVRYTLKLGTSSTSNSNLSANVVRLKTGPTSKYLNNDTGQTEERPPAPPANRDYLFTSLSPEGKMIERTLTGTNLADLVRVQQQIRTDHVIIEITYKGEA